MRLQRTGRKNLPSYRIVVAEHARPVKGKFLDILGHYLPARGEPVFEVDAERTSVWLKKGATPSDTLARLFKRSGMKEMDRYIRQYAKRKSKNEAAPETVTPIAA